MAKDDGIIKKVGDAAGGVAKAVTKASNELEKLANASGRQAEALKDHTGSIEAVSKSLVDIMTTPWQKMAQVIGTNVETFKELSQTGITFGNSMNNIRMGAADMRMSMGEFSEFMTTNQKSFASLGGTVGKGAEEFAKLSKQMVNSELGEKMMQLGYSSKELNEVLAIQIGASKAKLSAEDGSRERAIASAMKMAEEMDSLAKLTGVSRKEQEETRKALQKDMAFEAAMRQETRNMSKEDAEKYRAAMMDLVATTEATQGAAAGAAIKESIITGGSLQSSGAMAHASLNSEAYQKSMEAREKIKQGDYEGAKKTKEQSDAAAITSQNSDANLSVARFAGGTAGQVARGTMSATQTQFEGLKALDSSLKDVGGLMAKQKDMIKEEQDARDGHTRAMIQAKIELEKANAAAVRSVGSSMAKGTEFDKNMNKMVDRATDPKTRTTQQGLEKEFDKTFGGISKDIAGAAGKGVEETAKVLTEAATKIKQVADETIGLIKKFKETLSNPNRAAATPTAAPTATPTAAPTATPANRTGPERRAEGGPVKPGEPYWVGEKGPELVVPEQAGNVVSTDKLDKGAGKPANNPGIDISGQFKDLSTTVSKAQKPAAKEDSGKSAAVEETKKFADEELKITKKANQEKLDAANSIVLNTMGLNSKQKEMHGELAKLTLDDSKTKLEANKKQLEANLKELQALDAKANAIEETAKKEGRALTESEQAQIDAIDKENQEKMKANSKANTKMADENKALEKLIEQKTFAEKNGLQVTIAENGKLVGVVENNSKKIADDMKDALPVKEMAEKKTELSDQIAEAGKTLDEHGKTTLKYAMTYSSESNAAYKDSAERSIVNTQNSIEEKNKLIAELEEKGKTQELSTREKKRIEITKGEIQELEEKKKFREQEVEAYTLAEQLKKGIVTKSANDQVAITEKVSSDIKQELSGVMENVGDNFDVSPTSETPVNKETDDKYGKDNSAEKIMADIKNALPTSDIDKEKMGGDMLANMGRDEKYSDNTTEKNMADIMSANLPRDEKYADNSAEKIMADIKDALPTSKADLEKMGGDMLANMPREPKYSDVKEDPTARIKADMQTESINKAKATKFSDISIDASGMPVVKSKAESLKKEDPKPPTPSPGKKINPETGEEYTPVDMSKPSQSASGAKEAPPAKANLDDVVKKLELLNTTMNTLIKKTEDISAKQIQATKGIASGNLFGAH